MKKNLKVKGFALAAVMLIGISGVTVNAGTYSKYYSEFGTFTAKLIQPTSNSIYATTTTTKVTPTVRTKLTVENNATGVTLFNKTVTTFNGTSAPKSYTINNTSLTLAAFTTHEAIGTTSVAYYDAEIF